nr:hypothetical protein [uncultured Desulfobulbus sp.]
MMEAQTQEKYSICVSDLDKYLFFFIEPDKKEYQPENSQISLSSVDFPFLPAESFVNAAELIICNPVACRIVADYGQIPPQILKEIRTSVQGSITLAARHIEIISRCLG